MHAFGAFDDSGSLKAFAHIVQHPNTWNISECVYLEDLFVTSDARRQGFARALIEAVYAFAKRQQCHRVYWVTAKDNANAQALYQQLAQETGMVQFQHDIKNLYSQS